MFLRVLFVVIALISLNGVYCQEADDREQRTIQLTREMVDGLLQVLSPPCKSEMEAALGSQIEISDECKYEIQNTLASMQNPNGEVPQTEAQQEKAPEPTPKQPRAKRQRSTPVPPAATPSTSSSPIIFILGFVALFFGAIGALVVYINKERGNVPPAVKPKKLSKKKEEKQRQQQQQQAARLG